MYNMDSVKDGKMYYETIKKIVKYISKGSKKVRKGI